MTHSDDIDFSAGAAFAAQLDVLFQSVRNCRNQQYSAKEIVERANERGYRLTGPMVCQYRKGRVASPSFHAVAGFAAAFDVDISYFMTPAEVEWTTFLDELHRSADELTVHAVYGLRGLHPESIRLVGAMIDSLAQAHQGI